MSTALAIDGVRQHGQDVRTANVNAVTAVATILKSSLGPQGLDKMLVDGVGDVTVTNDGATILNKLEIKHPAAKVLQDLSRLQDQEVGDGTTSVVLIASELLKKGNELIKNGIHATTIIQGYRLAMKECVKHVTGSMGVKTKSISENIILNVAKTSLNSKLIGTEHKIFPKLVIDAMRSVSYVGPDGKLKYPVGQVNILKSHGASSSESQLIINGYAIALGRAAQGMPTSVNNARIALLDFDLRKARMGLGVKIQVTDPAELEKIRQKEMDITKNKINTILNKGVNVVLTTGGMDDMAMKYLIDKGVFGVRRVDKKDMKRIAKATGGKMLLTLTGSASWEEEQIDEEAIGKAESVYEERVGDNEYTFISKTSSGSKASTLLLRGANDYMLDEMERSLHDSLCAVSRMLESGTLVGGGGCVETALSLHLEDWAIKHTGREQMAIMEFAEALMSIPKILIINAALPDVAGLVAQLRLAHSKGHTNASLNLTDGKIVDAVESGVIEPMISKLKSIKFATEAAITILRIDDMIKLDPVPEPRDPRMG